MAVVLRQPVAQQPQQLVVLAEGIKHRFFVEVGHRSVARSQQVAQVQSHVSGSQASGCLSGVPGLLAQQFRAGVRLVVRRRQSGLVVRNVWLGFRLLQLAEAFSVSLPVNHLLFWHNGLGIKRGRFIAVLLLAVGVWLGVGGNCLGHRLCLLACGGGSVPVGQGGHQTAGQVLPQPASVFRLLLFQALLCAQRQLLVVQVLLRKLPLRGCCLRSQLVERGCHVAGCLLVASQLLLAGQVARQGGVGIAAVLLFRQLADQRQLGLGLRTVGAAVVQLLVIMGVGGSRLLLQQLLLLARGAGRTPCGQSLREDSSQKRE